VFLVVDGWGSFQTECAELEQTIRDIATRGLTYGIHLMLSSSRWMDVRPWLRDMVQTRIEVRLGDSTDSEMDFRMEGKDDNCRPILSLSCVGALPAQLKIAEGVGGLAKSQVSSRSPAPETGGAPVRR